jgi:hypothetical protein
MATQTVRVCDFDEGACARPATCYKVWRDGDRQAWTLDLCEEHAVPLLVIVAKAERVDLPVKPRVKMEPTTLRATPKTRPLKK